MILILVKEEEETYLEVEVLEVVEPSAVEIKVLDSQGLELLLHSKVNQEVQYDLQGFINVKLVELLLRPKKDC